MGTVEATRKSPACTFLSLGLIDYGQAWAMQKALAEARSLGRVGDVLLLLEHPHVFTLGRRGRREDVLASPEELERLGAQVYQVDRGGEVTYHGPGQLVGYPIVDIRPLGGPRLYVRGLEELLIRTLADFGIAAGREEGLTGVWVGREKIAAIGVKVTRSVTTHGFALNVNPDLSYFDYIVPCGLPQRGATSMERLLGCRVSMEEVQAAVARHFGEVFGYAVKEASNPSEVLRSQATVPG